MFIQNKDLKKYSKILLLAIVGSILVILLLLYTVWFAMRQEEKCGRTNFSSSGTSGTNPEDPTCSTVDDSISPYQR